jgi:hypothetical protein
LKWDNRLGMSETVKPTSAALPFSAAIIDSEGSIDLGRPSVALHVTKTELAAAAGLSRHAISKTIRSGSQSTQTRLREMTEILNRVIPWSGSPAAALAWYRSQSVPAFGDQTAEKLVQEGRAAHVLEYLGAIGRGGYA